MSAVPSGIWALNCSNKGLHEEVPPALQCINSTLKEACLGIEIVLEVLLPEAYAALVQQCWHLLCVEVLASELDDCQAFLLWPPAWRCRVSNITEKSRSPDVQASCKPLTSQEDIVSLPSHPGAALARPGSQSDPALRKHGSVVFHGPY